MQSESLTFKHAPSAGSGAQEDEFLARQAHGDPQAFGELYGRYVERVYRFLLARMGSTEDAQDLTSQTFLAAWERIDSYGGRGSFGGWLFGIARHKLADHYRQRRAQVSLDDVEWLHHPDPSQ